MPRGYRNPFRVPKPTKRAPKPIRVVAPKLDTSGLERAYEWFPVSAKTAFKLALEWFGNNLPTLLFGDPLVGDRERMYNRAVKAQTLGENNTEENEVIQAWKTAITQYEKVWASRKLPSLAEAMNNTKVSKRVENIQTVLTSLNNAFRGLVSFSITFRPDREYRDSEILLPETEIERMIPYTPLKLALAEAPTVAKVLSIVTDTDGNQSLDGEQFMIRLPNLLEAVADWAGSDRDLAYKAIGKVSVRSAPVAADPTAPPVTHAPRATAVGRGKGGSKSIHVIDASLMPRMNGKRKTALDAVLTSATVNELKANLAAAGIADYAGFAIQQAVKTGAIELR